MMLSGGLVDAAMLTTVGDLGVPIVLMHWRPRATSGHFTHHDDVVAEVVLARVADAAVGRGLT